VLGGLGPPWIRAIGYALIAGVAAWAGWRDLHRAEADDGSWPAFWFTCAAVFAILAAGRAADWGDLVSEVGRRDARAAGWYDQRRDLQVLLVAGVLALFALTALVALWRAVAHDRVRYLPLMLVVLGLAAYVGVRVASLHQIDALLHNRSVDGLQVGAGLELLGIGLAAGLAGVLLTRPVPVPDNRVSPPS
jgi:hypothetical protein